MGIGMGRYMCFLCVGARPRLVLCRGGLCSTAKMKDGEGGGVLVSLEYITRVGH